MERWKEIRWYIIIVNYINIGFYVQDKKEGFGIYYWENLHKAYLGFWKNGKQHGVGKYINPKKQDKQTKFGLWKEGQRTKWFNSEEEAMNILPTHQKKFIGLFKHDLEDIKQFLTN